MKKSLLPIITAAFIAIAFLFTTGCKKDTITNTVHDTTTLIQHDITKTEWVMNYGASVFYAPIMFIKSGTAKYPATLPRSGYWFSGFALPVPPELTLNIDNDSLRLEVNARNIDGDGTANQISLTLSNEVTPGLSNTNAVEADWQKGSDPSFCVIRVMSQTTNNISQMLTDVNTYSIYAVNVQGGNVNTYKNGSLLRTVSYTGSVGQLRNIFIAYRGAGEMDYVRLYKGNKLIMSEDFNTDGKSTAVWYRP